MYERQINVKRLTRYGLVFILSLLFVFCLNQVQKLRNASAYLKQAKRAIAENRPLLAFDYLERYVKMAPDDLEGLTLFGNQFLELNDKEGAYITLQKAATKSPNQRDLQLKLLDLAITLGRYRDAIHLLEFRLLKETPDDVDLLEKLADLFEVEQRDEDAELKYEEIISSYPDRLSAYVKIAILRHEKLKRTEDAITTIDQMVLRNPNDPIAHNNRVAFLMSVWTQRKSNLNAKGVATDARLETLLQTCYESTKNALNLAPDDPQSLFYAMQVAYHCSRTDEAAEFAAHGIDVAPLDSRFYIGLSGLKSEANDTKGAVEVLRQGVARLSKDLELKWLFGDALADSNGTAEASQIVQQLTEAKYPKHFIDFLQGRILLGQGDWLASIPYFESARVGLVSNADLSKRCDLWQAVAYRELRFYEQQLNSVRRALIIDADWIPARLLLADGLMTIGSHIEASECYNSLIQRNKANKEALLGMAKCYLMFQLKKGDNKRNWYDFDQFMDQLQGLKVAPAQVAMLRIEKSLTLDRRDEAEQIIQSARKENPDEVDLWTTQIFLALLDEKYDRVTELLDEAEAQFGDIPQIRLQRCRYYSAKYEAEAAEDLVRLSVPNESWTEQQRIQFSAGIASLFLLTKDYDSALIFGNDAIALDSKNLGLRLLLLEIVLRAKRIDAMPEVLEGVKSITGEGSVWNYAQAIFMVLRHEELDRSKVKNEDQNFLDDALAYLKKAQIISPTWDRVSLLTAEIQEIKKSYTTAIEYYVQAIKLGERRSVVVSHVLFLMFEERRFEEAERLINFLRANQSSYADEMARAEVDVSLQLGRKENALRIAEKLVRNSEQAKDPYWFGRVFLALEKPEEAVRQFRRAIEINPTLPLPWVGLVRAYTSAGAIAQAEIALEESKAAISPEEVFLAAGRSYEILGKIDLARKNYQSGVDESPADLGRVRELADFLIRSSITNEAEVILRGMLESARGDDKESLGHQAWAQRKLAGILMMEGGSAKLNESLTIIDRNLTSSNQGTVEDLRLKASILASGPNEADHRAAVVILEKLLTSNPTGVSAAEDRFLLARLYLQLNDRSKARNELRNLMAFDLNNPMYLTAYAQLSLQAGESTEADLYLTQLKRLAPNELTTVDIEIQIAYDRGQYEKISKILKNIGDVGLKSEQKAADAETTSRLWAAKRLEEFARLLSIPKESETAAQEENRNQARALMIASSEYCYEKFVAERPEEMLIYAQFLSQTPRVDRALDLLQEYGPTSSPLLVANMAITMMKNPRASSQQLQRLQQLFEAYMQNHEKILILELTSTELRSWSGDYTGAIAAYRKLLEKNGRSMAILNNLSVLLAQVGGDTEEALGLIEQAIEFATAIPELLDSRGLIHLAAKRPEKALADFQLSLNRLESPVTRFHLAVALAELKQFGEATKSLSIADAGSFTEQDLHPLERSMLKSLRIQLKEYSSTAKNP